MPKDEMKIGGVVLAGGRSSRMGENKALMTYQGQKLVDHMANLLRQAGCAAVHISGEVPGYDCIADAVRHEGPVRAMTDLLRCFSDRYERLLFVPVDMPLIAVEPLRQLMSQGGNVYYRDHPLPVCLRMGDYGLFHSVREFLDSLGAQALELPPEWEDRMANINTQEEWKMLASLSITAKT